MKNPPLTEVVQTAADLPFPAPSDAKGAYWRGTVYLVADNLSSPQDAREVIAHEMFGRYGLRGFFGGKLSEILNQIHAINPRVRLDAAEWTLQNKALIAEWQTNASSPTIGWQNNPHTRIRGATR